MANNDSIENNKAAAIAAHKFRYLLPPGNNFHFVRRFKLWMVMSCILMVVCIGILFVNKSVRGEYMNWTIDFRGGTEIVYAFHDKADPSKFVSIGSGEMRDALSSGGEDGFDVSEMSWTDEKTGAAVNGIIVRTPRFSAIKPEQNASAVAAFEDKFKDREISKASWSGERLYVRSKQPISNDEAAAVFTAAGLELKPWSDEDTKIYGHADEGTKEYNQVFAMRGIDRQIEQMILKKRSDVTVQTVQSYGVGAKAGAKLRNDAIKSLVYAIFLIMLYLAFRFDIRYAPGAAFATLHDAVMVIGVFAVTWTEVSLTTVAALLTVIGYSVNDTVIIFDRIRENTVKYKDKKLERIIDLSINETLVRSILTSLTVFATTLVMNIFGTGLVRNFAFAMNIGVIVGTYSSILIASPLFLWISNKWYSGPVKNGASAPISSAPQV